MYLCRDFDIYMYLNYEIVQDFSSNAQTITYCINKM